MNYNNTLSKLEKNFEARNNDNKKYKVEVIINNTMYNKEVKNSLSAFYYPIF